MKKVQNSIEVDSVEKYSHIVDLGYFRIIAARKCESLEIN